MADVEEEEAPPEAEDEQNDGEEAEEDLDGEGDYEDQEGEEEEQSDGEEEDPFELLDESEPEDEEQQAMYKEYLELVKEIDAQNLIIRELKAKSTRLLYKKCKTFRDKQEYKQLRACQEQEDIHLRALVNRAIQLQNFGSPRRYGDVELEFTEADQNYFFTGLQPSSYSNCESCSVCCFSESDLDSDSDDDPCCT